MVCLPTDRQSPTQVVTNQLKTTKQGVEPPTSQAQVQHRTVAVPSHSLLCVQLHFNCHCPVFSLLLLSLAIPLWVGIVSTNEILDVSRQPHSAVAAHQLSDSVNWCLAEGLGNGYQRCSVDFAGWERLHFLHFRCFPFFAEFFLQHVLL